MTQRRLAPITEFGFDNNVSGFPTPDQYTSQGFQAPWLHSSSLTDITVQNPAEDYVMSPAADFSELAYSSWLLEVNSSTSSMSRSASLSGSDDVFTPPSHAIPLAGNQHNNFDHDWQRRFTGGNSRSPQLPAMIWNSRDYVQPDMSVPANYSSTMSAAAPTANLQLCHELIDHGHARSFEALEPEALCSPGKDEKDSDLGSDQSISEDESSRCNDCVNYAMRSSSRPRRGTSSVLNLGRWSHTISQPEVRQYACPYGSRDDAPGRPCKDERFGRVEHLRRHVKTVHSSDKPFHCQVPLCHKKFSRNDNLRDHYWTHIYRGGRAGTNLKMSLEELKPILKPKERHLIKKLKAKLNKHRSEQMTKELSKNRGEHSVRLMD